MPRKLTNSLLIEIANLTPRQLSNSLPIANSTPRQLANSLQAPITHSLPIANSTPRQLANSLQAPIANSLPIDNSTSRELTHSLLTRVARLLIPPHAIDQFQRLDRERQVVQEVDQARHQEIATGVEFLLQQAQIWIGRCWFCT
jgi:hypothetical protein